MAKFYILIGPSGSGKSTWARQKCGELSTIRLNRDELRTMLKGRYVFGNRLVEAMCTEVTLKLAQAALNASIDVILDNTNCTIKTITEVLSQIPSDVTVQFVVFDIPYWKQRYRCIMRWIKGGIWIPESVSQRMDKSFREVLAWLKDNNYDYIRG